MKRILIKILTLLINIVFFVIMCIGLYLLYRGMAILLTVFLLTIFLISLGV